MIYGGVQSGGMFVSLWLPHGEKAISLTPPR